MNTITTPNILGEAYDLIAKLELKLRK